jgi:hypothetical protein
MKLLNFIKSFLFAVPKIEQAVEKIEAVVEEVAAPVKPKRKRNYKKK